MRRPALYSRSPRPSPDAAQPSPWNSDDPAGSTPPAAGRLASGARTARPGVARWHPGWRSFVALLLVASLAVLIVGTSLLPRQAHPSLTQRDIDAAVLRTLQTAPLPSPAAKAIAAIRPSVVQVTSYGPERTTPTARLERRGRNLARSQRAEANRPQGEVERGIGSGVVVIDKGVILTNLHVVAGAQKIKVTFSDGFQASASVVGVQPDNDLAVLQAQQIPDDLVPATLRSTTDLRPGDRVVAVGFPFGIGPSASAGIVSGLNRSFRSPEGQQEMRNLIQFDAAANPGNSGGPLVDMEGHVLGIVTAILNPTEQRTFIGIGFALPIESAAVAVGPSPF